jgi:hypothetical protein
MTKVGKGKGEIDKGQEDIRQAVFRREMLKKQLAAMDELARKGYHHDFERFRDEYLTELVLDTDS